MSREIRITLFVLSFVIMFTACERHIISPLPDTDLEEILNIQWALQSFRTDHQVVLPPEDQPYTITFETDSTFSGRADCNEIFGNYFAKADQSMRVKRIGTTYVYCGENSMDDRYLKALSSVNSFSVRESRLFLKYGKNSSLVFRKNVQK